MICRLQYPTARECGMQMIARETPGVGVLYACVVHDGDAADYRRVDRRFNRPRPDRRHE